MIAINKPLLDEAEVQAVSKVLRSCILTGRTERSDSEVRRFEKAFSQFVKAKYAFAVNSGTSALYMSLLAADVGYGSEVIVPSFTFVATAESVLMLGAKPVFVDIDPETYNIDSQLIEKAITNKTKAIIPVDLFGLPADMESIKEIAVNHNLILVEDAAQAHGAEYKGMPPGSFSDFACWSFYASKNMTTGEGGMITTNEEKYRDTLPYMRSHGEKEEYISSMMGGNFRMPEMEAAIGNVQLSKLPDFLTARRENAERLLKRLNPIDELQLPIVPKGYKPSWYLFTVKLKNANETRRDKIVNELRKLGIGASVYYRCPIHLMPLYRRLGKSQLPMTEEVAKLVFSLPVHPGVTSVDLEHIVDSTKKLLN